MTDLQVNLALLGIIENENTTDLARQIAVNAIINYTNTDNKQEVLEALQRGDIDASLLRYA